MSATLHPSSPGVGASPRAASLVIPVLAALIATCQVVLAWTVALTPWKGAGFGMFSTVDAGPLRQVRMELRSANRTARAVLPPTREFQLACNLPTDGNLEALADWASRQLWIPVAGTQTGAPSASAWSCRPWDHAGAMPRDVFVVDSLSIAVARPVMSSEGCQLSMATLRSADFAGKSLAELAALHAVDATYLRPVVEGNR